jgi:hypothetical protein
MMIECSGIVKINYSYSVTTYVVVADRDLGIALVGDPVLGILGTVHFPSDDGDTSIKTANKHQTGI